MPNNLNRIFHIADHAKASQAAASREIMHESAECRMTVWQLYPGQSIEDHIHSDGQDSWVVISGEAEYRDGTGTKKQLKAGDVAIAFAGQTHGATNNGTTCFTMISCLTPAQAGYKQV